MATNWLRAWRLEWLVPPVFLALALAFLLWAPQPKTAQEVLTEALPADIPDSVAPQKAEPQKAEDRLARPGLPAESAEVAKVPPVTAPGQPEPVQPSVRDVGGNQVSLPFDPDMLLERIAPRVDPSPLTPVELSRDHLLFRPVVREVGRISAKGWTVTLEGIVPIAADRLCVGASGARWACGVRARAAFSAFVRGRAVTCLLPPPPAGPVTTHCRIAKQDVAGWLVAQGWAEPAAGSDYAELATAARQAQRGIHGDGR
jgi:endonuclease YncB( thermonuclease family)